MKTRQDYKRLKITLNMFKNIVALVTQSVALSWFCQTRALHFRLTVPVTLLRGQAAREPDLRMNSMGCAPGRDPNTPCLCVHIECCIKPGSSFCHLLGAGWACEPSMVACPAGAARPLWQAGSVPWGGGLPEELASPERSRALSLPLLSLRPSLHRG